MRGPFRGALVALALAAALPRCAKGPTSLFVRVSSDGTLQPLLPTARMANVRVYDADQSAEGPLLDSKAVALGTQFEATFLVMAGGGARRVRIDVEVPLAAGSVLDRALVSYVDDQVLDVNLVLRGACRPPTLRTPCPASQRCNASAACEDAAVRGTPHPE